MDQIRDNDKYFQELVIWRKAKYTKDFIPPKLPYTFDEDEIEHQEDNDG
jgi:hypothetical protein